MSYRKIAVRVRYVLLLLIVSIFAGRAEADSVKIGGSVSGVPTAIIMTNFTISSPSGASPATSPCVLVQGAITTSSPLCLFQNDIPGSGTGVTISSLTFDILNFPSTSVTCGFLTGSPFANCTVGSLGSSGTEVTFNNGSIPFQTNFTLQLGTQGSFPDNTQFAATASTGVPEPGTTILLLVGLLSFGLLVRTQSRRTHC